MPSLTEGDALATVRRPSALPAAGGYDAGRRAAAAHTTAPATSMMASTERPRACSHASSGRARDAQNLGVVGGEGCVQGVGAAGGVLLHPGQAEHLAAFDLAIAVGDTTAIGTEAPAGRSAGYAGDTPQAIDSLAARSSPCEAPEM